MRSFAVVAVLAAVSTPATASGWKTTVVDRADGVRSIALMGLASESEAPGIAISCTGIHEGFPAMLFVTVPPSNRYEFGPGTAAEVEIAGIARFLGAISENDSIKTTVWFEDISLPAALGQIAVERKTEITLKIMDFESTFEVHPGGADKALREFRDACKL